MIKDLFVKLEEGMYIFDGTHVVFTSEEVVSDICSKIERIDKHYEYIPYTYSNIIGFVRSYPNLKIILLSDIDKPKKQERERRRLESLVGEEGAADI